jgi:hypothetical protein
MLLALATGLALMPSAANAQDRARLKKTTHYSAPSCDDGKNLVVCVDERERPSRRSAKNRDSSGPISKFAKLAGMFMGRVDAADVGSFKFRFRLELADARDFVRE